jgi:hypothetical protein
VRSESLEERFVTLGVAGIEHEHRIREPGDHAPPDDLGLPGETVMRALERDEILN